MGEAVFGANLWILGFKRESFPCMNVCRYTPDGGWSIFGGQRFMAWFKAKKGNFEGEIALTARAKMLHPVSHDVS
jgi:hypothetical protein